MNINEIKERHKQDEIDMHKISKGQLHEDRAYLLSIIEQAEKALSDTKDELAKVVNKMCGGTVKRYIFEETREVYYSVDKALQAIRKGD